MSRPLVAAVVKSFPPAYRSGGPGRSVSSLVELLADELDFRVITSVDDNGYDLSQDGIETGRWVRRNGAEVFTLSSSVPVSAFGMVRELRRLRPDVIYLNTFFNPVFAIAPLVARRLGLLHRARIVIAPRGEFSPGALGLKSTKKRRMLRAFARFGLGDGVVWHATSDLEADLIAELIGPDTAIRTAPVLRSLVIETFDPGAGNKPDGSAEHGPLRMVLLSKVDRMKNVVGALEAMALAASDVHLTIAGPVKEPDYWDECLAAIDRLGLASRVTVHGPVDPDEVTRFLSDFDLFLLPTRGENFGHVILEALAAGLPVIISDTTRWSHLDEEGAGWVIALADLSGFAAAIDRAASLSVAERQAMASAARRMAARYLDDPEALLANGSLLWPTTPRIAVVNYSFPVTTQTFHHRRHRVLAEAGALAGIHFVNSASGKVEAAAGTILSDARPIPRRALPAAVLSLLRPSIAWLLVRGLVLARADNGEGGRAGFAWQALNGVALGRRLRRSDATVVHAVFASAPATLALFASRAAGLPWSVEVHSPTSAQTNPRLLAFKLQRADLVVAISDYTAELVERLAPGVRVEVVHCGLDASPSCTGRPTALSSGAKSDEQSFEVVAVGSLIPKKGHDVLIRASGELARRLPHRVGIVGGGPLRDELQALIDSTGAPVTLLGQLPPDDVAAVRSHARVGVLASRRSEEGDEDGVPVSLMEFMAEGIPVVSCDVAGIVELLDSGHAGGVVCAGDEQQLAKVLERALVDEAWRTSVSEAARRRVAERYDNRAETLRLIDLLSSLVRSEA